MIIHKIVNFRFFFFSKLQFQKVFDFRNCKFFDLPKMKICRNFQHWKFLDLSKLGNSQFSSIFSIW